jgi:hypothetical protein
VLFAIFGFIGAFQVLFNKSAGPIAKTLVTASDGTEYLVKMRQGPGGKPSAFIQPGGYSHLWAALRLDRSWWVNVETSRSVPWPVLRERYPSERDAAARVAELLEQVKAGSKTFSAAPALWRRPTLIALRK